MNKFFLLFVLALGFLVILGDGLATYFYTKKTANLFVEKSKLDHEEIFFQNLLIALIEIQTGETGYILTGENQYVDSLNRSIAFLNDPKTKAALAEQGKDNVQVHDLNQLIEEKLVQDEMNGVLRQSQRSRAIQSIDISSLDKMKLAIQKIVNDKKNIILNKEKDLIDQMEKIGVFATITNGLVFALMGFSLIVIYLYACKEEKKQKQIVALEKLRNAIMTHSQEIILTLDPNGTIISCNRMVEKITGFNASDLIGKNFNIFIRVKDDEDNLKHFSKKYSRNFKTFSDLLLFAREQPIEEDVVWSFKGDKRLHFQASITPLKDAEWVFIGFLIEGNDITERVKLSEKLVESNAIAENAKQAQSRFLVSMSHDLRTPLTAVIGYAELLEENREDNLTDKQKSFLKRIAENGQHLLEMINDILLLEKFETRKEVLKVTDVRVGDLIEQIFQEVEGTAKEKNIGLRSEGLEDCAPIQTDQEKLYRILTNLIINAVKFTHQGSVSVVIKQNVQTRQPVQIQVVDTGIGIDPRYRSQVFEPFFQVNRQTSQGIGNGLGLSICKAYSQLLGYRISFTSELGKGSTFTLDLT